MTDAERQARHRAALAAGAPVVRMRRPADHRGRARRWHDAVAQLTELQAQYAVWLEALPDNLQDGATADALRAHIIETFFSALIIIVLISTPIPWLRSRFTKFVGDISYSIYLLHFVVFCVIAKVFALLHLNLNTVAMTFLLACATYAVTILLAWLSNVYIEQPGVRLGKAVLSLRGTKVGSNNSNDPVVDLAPMSSSIPTEGLHRHSKTGR